jgi:hypothetical protein
VVRESDPPDKEQPMKYGTVIDPDGVTRAANKDPYDGSVWYEVSRAKCDWDTAETFTPYPAR